MKLSHSLILASQSPRRHQLLKGMGFDFEVRTKDTDESFDPSLKGPEIPLYLCEKKAAAFLPGLKTGELLITADTVVWIQGKVLNKPADRAEAKEMLNLLSGNMHEVFTAVCLASTEKKEVFYACTRVYFKVLKEEEIDYYIDTHRPFDKAGSYGAQEWMGYIGIEKIEGSYFNVMGLPTKELYEQLTRF